jgi:hypothetical protein
VNIPWWGKLLLVLLLIWCFIHPAEASAGADAIVHGVITTLKGLH